MKWIGFIKKIERVRNIVDIVEMVDESRRD